VAARAQKIRTVGILMNSAVCETLPQSNVTAFVDGMRALGWVDGRNLHIEYRWNGGSAERAKTLAQELAKLAR
jgi:putative ABC transport system substrate-binding protein